MDLQALLHFFIESFYTQFYRDDEEGNFVVRGFCNVTCL